MTTTLAAVALTVAGALAVGVLVFEALSRAIPEPAWKA